MFSKVSSIDTLNNQKVDNRAPDEEESKVLNIEDKSVLTPIGDVQYHIDLSRTVTVQTKTSKGDSKDGIPTFHEQISGTPHIGD